MGGVHDFKNMIGDLAISAMGALVAHGPRHIGDTETSQICGLVIDEGHRAPLAGVMAP